MPEGLQCEYVDGILVQTFTDSNDAAVAAWAAILDDAMAQSTPDIPFRVLVDVSAKQVSFTRAARQHTTILFTRHRQQPGRIAFFFSSRTAPYFSRIFFASLGKLAFELNHFSSPEKAIEWLKLP
ncbi:MAG: hypothetical protein R3E39_13245 [Anaerolineae bacterium]